MEKISVHRTNHRQTQTPPSDQGMRDKRWHSQKCQPDPTEGALSIDEGGCQCTERESIPELTRKAITGEESGKVCRSPRMHRVCVCPLRPRRRTESVTAKCEAKREPLVAWLLTSVVAEVALAEAVTEAFPGPYYPGPQAW